jgi:hypothetical protein
MVCRFRTTGQFLMVAVATLVLCSSIGPAQGSSREESFPAVPKATEIQNQAMFLAAALGKHSIMNDAIEGKVVYWKHGKAHIQQGTQIKYNISWTDPNRYTALHIAALNDHLETCQKLVEYGWRMDATDLRGLTPGKLAFQHGNYETAKTLGFQGKAGGNSLETNGAASKGEREQMKAEYENNNALFIAVTRSDEEMVHHAVINGKSIEVDWNTHYKLGITPGSSRANVFMQYDPRWSKAGNKKHDRMTGWTALHMAAYKNNLEIIKDLLDAGWDKTQRNGQGQTPLDISEEWETIEVLKTYYPRSRLETKGQEVDDDGSSPPERSMAYEPGGVVTPESAAKQDLDEADKAFIAGRMEEYKKNGPQYFSPPKPSEDSTSDEDTPPSEGAGILLWDEQQEFQQRQHQGL